jgi:flavin reductase (DIM6/NTAB) family NADH-FMN oxidoreductase RutF
MEIKFEELNDHLMYNLLTGCVLPRPIAWVSTMNAEGQLNLAPFSAFCLASFNPPVVCFAPTLKSIDRDGEKVVVPKDTLRNIGNNYEFVINIVSRELVEKMDITATPYPANVNEFEMAGVTPAPSTHVKVPRVKEAKASFECSLRQIINFGRHDLAGNLVLGDILGAHVADGLWEGGHIDLDMLNPVGRLSGIDYCSVEDRFKLGKPVLGGK